MFFFFFCEMAFFAKKIRALRNHSKLGTNNIIFMRRKPEKVYTDEKNFKAIVAYLGASHSTLLSEFFYYLCFRSSEYLLKISVVNIFNETCRIFLSARRCLGIHKNITLCSCYFVKKCIQISI